MKLHPLTLALAGLASLSLSLPAIATTTVGVGYEYTSGKYGTGEKTTEQVVPVSLKQETGPWTFKLTVPWVSVKGPGNPNNALGNARANQTESGLGDVTAAGFYNIYNDPATKFGIDLGLKAKFATADKAKTSITTGENDYSVQADFYGDFKPIQKTTWFGTVGWTKKGDPSGVNYKDPVYLTAGFSYKLDDQNSWGAAYDYRSKLLAGRDPISEASVFFTHRYSQVLKIQGYGLTSVASDASPDYGVGVNVFYSF